MNQSIDEMIVNNELEGSVIGCLIISPDLLYDSEILEEYFMDLKKRNIFNTIVNLSKLRKTIDITTLVGELGSDYSDLVMTLYMKHPSTIGFNDYLEKLKEYRQLRQMKRLGQIIQASTVDKVDNLISTAYNTIGELLYKSREDLNTGDAIHNLLDNAGKPNNRLGFFGYKEIDSRTFGIKEGKFIILMARPGVGKTLTAVNIMNNLMDQGIKSMMLSGEMLQVEVLQRFLSVRYDIAPYIFESRTGPQIMELIKDGDDFSKIQDYIYVSDKPLIDTLIYHQIYKSYHRDGIKIFFVDYIQLASTSSKSQNRAIEIGEISNTLKRMCNELGITIIAPAQVSREGAKSGKVGLEHLKDCGTLEQDADIVWSLDKEEDENGKITGIEITILKNRQGGGTGSFRYKNKGAKILNQLIS